jgi:virginiamycin B lyase
MAAIISRRRVKNNGLWNTERMRPAVIGSAHCVSLVIFLLLSAVAPTQSANMTPRSIAELTPTATLALGKTADWVAIGSDAVWVGSTGPFAVHRIDPNINRVIAEVALPGAPCAGLAVGFGSLWIPLCTPTPSLAKVDLADSRLAATFNIGAAAAEAGVTVDEQGVWLVTDNSGSLVRVDPRTGAVQAKVAIAAGSYNPHYSAGTVWISQAEGSRLTGVDAASLQVSASIDTGPNPRFLTSGGGAIWTLNQGDGSVTRIDAHTHTTSSIPLQTPGHGGDIKFDSGLVWSTMPKMPLSVIDAKSNQLMCQWAGPGGDSLGLGFGAIWLTDYNGGTVSRIPIREALRKCAAGPPAPP